MTGVVGGGIKDEAMRYQVIKVNLVGLKLTKVGCNSDGYHSAGLLLETIEVMPLMKLVDEN